MSFKISATFLQFFFLMSRAVFDFIQLSGLFSLLKNHPPSAKSQFHQAILGELAHLYCTYRTIIVQQVSKNKNYKIENKFMVFERELLKHSDE